MKGPVGIAQDALFEILDCKKHRDAKRIARLALNRLADLPPPGYVETFGLAPNGWLYPDPDPRELPGGEDQR